MGVGIYIPLIFNIWFWFLFYLFSSIFYFEIYCFYVFGSIEGSKITSDGIDEEKENTVLIVQACVLCSQSADQKEGVTLIIVS